MDEEGECAGEGLLRYAVTYVWGHSGVSRGRMLGIFKKTIFIWDNNLLNGQIYSQPLY